MTPRFWHHSEASAVLLPVAPGGGGGGGFSWRQNEPGGLSLVTERPYNTNPEDSWGLAADAGSTANFTIVTDATAPHSPSNVGQINFPNGFTGSGGAPCNSFKSINLKKMYLCTAFKVSSNWQGHPTEMNKIFIASLEGFNKLVLPLRGSDTNPLLPMIYLQNLASSFNSTAQGGTEGNAASLFLTQNIASYTLVRNTWVQWEAYIDVGTAGNSDGVAKCWFDGVLCCSYTGVPFLTATDTFDEFKWQPAWGGAGGTVSGAMQCWVDHLYLSGV